MHKLTAIVPDEPQLVFVSDRHSSIYASIRKVINCLQSIKHS